MPKQIDAGALGVVYCTGQRTSFDLIHLKGDKLYAADGFLAACAEIADDDPAWNPDGGEERPEEACIPARAATTIIDSAEVYGFAGQGFRAWFSGGALEWIYADDTWGVGLPEVPTDPKMLNAGHIIDVMAPYLGAETMADIEFTPEFLERACKTARVFAGDHPYSCRLRFVLAAHPASADPQPMPMPIITVERVDGKKLEIVLMPADKTTVAAELARVRAITSDPVDALLDNAEIHFAPAGKRFDAKGTGLRDAREDELTDAERAELAAAAAATEPVNE